jgi:hypothetical protein
MESTEGYKLEFTVHANEQLKNKGIDLDRAQEAFDNPARIYPNKKYVGQFRVVGAGICLIGKPGNGIFRVFTVYEDGVMTPPRPEQLLTEEGRRYAKIYERALLNGKATRQNEYYPRTKERKNAGDMRHTYIR